MNGRRLTLNLGVKVGGVPPPSLSHRDERDGASSASALWRKRSWTVTPTRPDGNDSAHLVERIYEIKTGVQIQSVKLAEVPDGWAMIHRKRTPNGRYAPGCRSAQERFADYVREHKA